MNLDYTMMFKPQKDGQYTEKELMKKVYDSLLEKGYDPISQIVGYFLSGDPSYITSHNDARTLIRKFERDELLEKIVRSFIEDK